MEGVDEYIYSMNANLWNQSLTIVDKLQSYGANANY